MVNTVQLTYPIVSRPLLHRWDIFTQVSKSTTSHKRKLESLWVCFLTVFLVLEWMHAYLSRCLLECEWMLSLYITFIIIFLYYLLVSAPLGD